MKKYLLGIFAVILAVSMSAYRMQPAKKGANTVFHFTGTAVTYAQITSTSNWELSNNEECNGESFTCQMSTADASSVPALVNYLTSHYSTNQSDGEKYVLDRTISKQD